MTKTHPLLFSRGLFDDQFGRTLASVYAGMADLGEAFAAAHRIGPDATPDTWYDGWINLARDVETVASAAAIAGHRLSARDGYLRASEYYRQAFFFIRHLLDDERLQSAYASHVRTFALAGPDFGFCQGTPVEIPYQETTLHGWFFTPDASGAIRPTVILPDGYDSTAEEMLSYGAGALRRGYNVLTFDGPGQGRALYLQRLYMHADFEAVLTPVIDWLTQRPDVEQNKLVLIGRSMGGYLAPRAAAFEHRIAALVCDPPDPNVGSHLPGGIVGLIAAPVVTVEEMFSADKREFFQARMVVHDVHTAKEYFDTLRSYDMLPYAGNITAPTLLVECENDPLAGAEGAATLAAAMTAPTTHIQLTAASGASGHCGGLGQQVWDAQVYDWLDNTI